MSLPVLAVNSRCTFISTPEINTPKFAGTLANPRTIHAEHSRNMKRLSSGLCRSVSDFSKGDKLGEGTYGSVYTAIDKASGQRVALKRVKLTGEGFEREGMPLTSLREISLLRQLQHPNIISLLDVVVGSRADSVFLVFEFCAFDLARVIDTMGKPFAHGEVKWMMSELVHAVEYIHANLVIHRDIKMSNILLAADGTLKLCDFGLARGRCACGPGHSGDGEAYTPRVVTLWYRAPELLLGATRYGPAVDMWSVGCILGELLLHRPLLPASTEIAQLIAICDLIGTPSERIWPDVKELPLWSKVQLPAQPYNDVAQTFAKVRPGEAAIDLLTYGLLTYDPKQRSSATETLKQRYFTSGVRSERPRSHAAFLKDEMPRASERQQVGVSRPTVYGGAVGNGASRSSTQTHQAPNQGEGTGTDAPQTIRLPSPRYVTAAGARMC